MLKLLALAWCLTSLSASSDSLVIAIDVDTPVFRIWAELELDADGIVAAAWGT